MTLSDLQMEHLLLAVRSVVLSGLILLAFAALRRQASRHRASLLLSGLALMLCLPLLTQWMPPVPWLQFELPAASEPEPLSRASVASDSLPRTALPADASGANAAVARDRYEGRHLKLFPDQRAARRSSVPPPGRIRKSISGLSGGLRSVSWVSAVGLIWLLGSCLLALRLLISLVGLEGLRRRSQQVSADLLPDGAAAIEVRCGGVVSPLTFGVLRPVVILPAGRWRGWSQERLKMVLRHEREHIARRDWASRVLAEAAVVLYWFNPLVWYLNSRLRLEQEFSCDQAVLVGGGLSARTYGNIFWTLRSS